VANDWRVTVTLHDPEHVGRALESLHEHEVEEDARRRLGHRVAVSAEGSQIFLSADFALDRWHPIEEEWEDASAAMPQTDEQREAEHERLEEDETRESDEYGYPQWEVRVEMPSRHAAEELAERLRAEGHPVVRRWTLLVLGANDSDDADALAQVVKQEAPADAKVETAELGPLLPFTQIGPIPIW
jgi:hypothetical protein